MWYHAVLFVFGICSFCLSVFMVFRLCRIKRNQLLVGSCVFNIFLCDSLISFRWLTVVAPATFNFANKNGNIWMDISPNVCKVIGVVGHFALVGYLCWSLVIDIILFLLLLGLPTANIRKMAQYQSVVCWCIVYSSTVVALVMNEFGPIDGSRDNCSIVRSARFYFNTIPCFITLAASILVVCMAGFRYRRFRKQKQARRLWQITAWASSFVLWWGIVTSRRLNQMFGGNDSNIWETVYEFVFCTMGTLDFFMWFRLAKISKRKFRYAVRNTSSKIRKKVQLASSGEIERLLPKECKSSDTLQNTCSGVFTLVN